MFGIGLSEFIVIIIVALIVIGPDKLPQLARTLGKAFSEFKKAGEEVRKSFNEAGRPEKEVESPDGGAEKGPGGEGR
ncbi:MAG: twin arginine-targeting protein translocase TatB [Deltaproteobacteria bacterium RBG_19FT_COMBO_56_10]|nr:MAG: twin arginine-targeting protein translocase TatB [Deltaproteobacteria bacterium RBG_19FT_COMBO_56_10]